MILNTGSRTDIPAYYSKWFYNRIREGYVLARNPYNPAQVTRYRLSSEVVDAIVFCTKNPEPMLERLGELREFETFWFVTITPYGRDIEPYVPPVPRVLESFIRLSERVGRERVSWRYDPILLTERYSEAFHIEQFRNMAARLQGCTEQVVISFLDLYEKTKKNFPEARAVSGKEQERLTEAFSETAGEYGLQIHLCCEKESLVRPHVDAEGCLSQRVLERALGMSLKVPGRSRARAECPCLLGADIGMYNTCGHGCLYCYANYDRQTVLANMARHDAASPFLSGGPKKEDVIRDARQKAWRDGQMSLPIGKER